MGGYLNFLVTGCAGFIGSHLVEQLCKSGDKVTGVDCLLPILYSRTEKLRNLEVLLKLSNFKFEEFDLRIAIPRSMLEKVDVIFNIAALPGLSPSWVNLQNYFDCNSVIVGNICTASKDLGGIPIIQASTSSVYGQNATKSENSTLSPVSPYGVSKLAAEHLLAAFGRNYDVPFTVLRYFSVYGPRQRPDMAYRKIIDSILHDNPIDVYSNGNQTRTNTYVTDVVEATIAASKSIFKGDVFNIGGSEPVSLLEAINVIESITAKKASIKFLPAKAGDQTHTKANCAKALEIFNFKPKVRFREGIKLQIKWQLDNSILV